MYGSSKKKYIILGAIALTVIASTVALSLYTSRKDEEKNKAQEESNAKQATSQLEGGLAVNQDEWMLETLPETEAETEAAPDLRYDLTLEGLTDAILESYRGDFNEALFLNALGDYFAISDEGSQLHDAATVTFIDEASEDPSFNVVSHYIIINGDSDRKVLSCYTLEAKQYGFYIVEAKKKEVASEVLPAPASETAAATGSQAINNQDTVGTGNASNNAANHTPEQSTIQSTFNLSNVSTVFIKYTGDGDAFFQAVHDYIFSRGYTDVKEGTFSSLEIDTDNRQATFTIRLDNGVDIHGTYQKDSRSYSFSG